MKLTPGRIGRLSVSLSVILSIHFIRTGKRNRSSLAYFVSKRLFLGEGKTLQGGVIKIERAFYLVERKKAVIKRERSGLLLPRYNGGDYVCKK